MHIWGDEWFEKNGDDLYRAINYCCKIWRRGRLGVDAKEKYGTFRHTIYFWDGGLWSLIRPGYAYIGGPVLKFIYFKVDPLIKLLTNIIGIQRLGFWIQRQFYNAGVQLTVRKFPHLKDELLSDLAHYEFLKPGIFGPLDGQMEEKKYWRTHG